VEALSLTVDATTVDASRDPLRQHDKGEQQGDDGKRG
jgi:hypothetical protein